MNTKQLLEALDNQISSGDVLGAFDHYFADNCVTMSSPEDKTSNKAQKLQSLRWFFDSLASTNHIERRATRIEGDTTLSEFVFDFTDRRGQNFRWHEVIRREWRDGKVVEEQYFTNLAKENPLQHAKPVAAEEKIAAPAIKGKKEAEPKADKKPAIRSSKKAVAQTDDLVLIEKKAGRK